MSSFVPSKASSAYTDCPSSAHGSRDVYFWGTSPNFSAALLITPLHAQHTGVAERCGGDHGFPEGECSPNFISRRQLLTSSVFAGITAAVPRIKLRHALC